MFPPNVDTLFVIETASQTEPEIWGATFTMLNPKLAVACAFFRRERAEKELERQPKTGVFKYRVAEYRRVEGSEQS